MFIYFVYLTFTAVSFLMDDVLLPSSEAVLKVVVRKALLSVSLSLYEKL
jgi:hypothetical protein